MDKNKAVESVLFQMRNLAEELNGQDLDEEQIKVVVRRYRSKVTRIFNTYLPDNQ